MEPRRSNMIGDIIATYDQDFMNSKLFSKLTKRRPYWRKNSLRKRKIIRIFI
jgi:hypothetical protein